VCLGNICRSPLAEAIFRKKIKELKLENVLSCDSAGTANYHVGDFPDHRTIRVATDHQVPVNHRGQQFKRGMSDTFDYLIAMDDANFRDISAAVGRQPDHLFLMRHFDPQQPNANVPDPYYGDMKDFEDVYQILDRSLDGLMAFLIERHGLKP